MKKQFTAKDLLFIVVAIALAAGMCVYAIASAGGSSDPLVTLSYINGPYKEDLQSSIMDEIKTDEFYDTLKEKLQQDITADSGTAATYEAIHLMKGQQINALGSCEVILRSGTGVAYVTSIDNRAMLVGLSDSTAAVEILDGEDVPKNHYIIISRGDGRGITVTSTDAYFLVRGSYQIKG